MSEELESGGKAAGAAALTASTAALACAACCVLPLALPATMLATLGGTLAVFAGAYRWLAPLAVVSVAAAWLWVGYQSRTSRKRPARSTIVILAVATAIMAIVQLWPAIEAPVAALLRTKI